MSAALQRIADIVFRVQELEMMPTAAINAISAILEAEREERRLTTLSRRDSIPMSTRAWLGLCLCALILGGLIGWGARGHTTGDRYMNSLAEEHETAAKFYNERTDQLIHANESTLKGIKK